MPNNQYLVVLINLIFREGLEQSLAALNHSKTFLLQKYTNLSQHLK